MNLSKQSSGHWYKHENGVWSAVHQVYKVDGSGLRNTTLADARKMQLVPSVTGICSIVNEPSLNNYWKTQAIMSALTLPRKQEDVFTYFDRCVKDLGQAANDAMAVVAWCHRTPPHPLITDDEHAHLVVTDMEAHSEAAKKLGTEIHDAISGFLTEHFLKKDEPVDVLTPPAETPEVLRLCQPATEWLLKNVEKVHAVEQIVGSLEHGYAGTLDLDADIKGIGRCIIDFKSQPVKRNGNGPKPAFYFSYGKQLSAYAVASVGHQKINNAPKLVSVVIDKANNGEVFVKVWENPAELWRQFLNNADSWRFENQYDPRVPEEGFKQLTKLMNEH